MPKYIAGLPIYDDPEYEWDIYDESATMSVYTVAMVVAKNSIHNFKEESLGNVAIRSWYRVFYNGTSNGNQYDKPYKKMEYNAKVTANYLEYYGNYYNMTYTQPKMDSFKLNDV